MRNIGIQREIKRSLEDQHDPDGDRIIDLACVNDNSHDEDEMNGPVGILTKNGFVYLVDHSDTITWKVNLNTLVSSPDTNNTNNHNNINMNYGWFNLTYVEPNFIALHHNGSIIAIHHRNDDDGGGGEGELVGEFENGIRTAAWNEDRSVLVLVTAVIDDDDDDDNDDPDPSSSIPMDAEKHPMHSVLLSLNTEWDVLSEVRIDRIDDQEPVSLCWTDTQLAINAVDLSDHMRKIRIYHGDTLELHAIGRTEDGSGKLAPNIQYSPITWAGSGCSHLLTAIQSKGRTKKLVAFFEPNGLRHREFQIRDDHDVVVGLQWNTKSDLLVVTLQPPPRQEGALHTSPIQKVQLWYRSNYHWHMKYEFRYHQEMPVIAKFHPTHPYILYTCLENLRWNVLQVRWDVCTKQIPTTALSVDGTLLNITNFNQAFVPPPMYANTITMPAPIHEIATTTVASCEEQSNMMYGVVSLSDASFIILTCDHEKVEYPSIRSTVQYRDTSHFDVASFRHLTIVDQQVDTRLCLLAIGTSWEDKGVDFLVEILIFDDAATIVGSHQLDQQCITLSPWFDSLGHGVLVQLMDGTLFEYSLTTSSDDTFKGILTPCAIDMLLEPCPWVQCQRHSADSPQSRLVIGMSYNGRLYCNDFQVADAISSFTISPENQFLSFATSGSACILRFIPLLDLINFDPLLGSDENAVFLGYEPRNIERGSLLVSVLTKKPSVVLQMTRGNLEIIQPRALVLRHSMLKTMDMNYDEAFQLMRRHKVDMNLIVDMNPYHFLERDGVTCFVEQVNNIDYLNLFISCLQDWDSTKERYPIPYWIKAINSDTETESSIDYSNKANLVCTRIRSVMINAQEQGHTKAGRTISEDHFLLPILSTFAKENPPKLEEALVMIRDNANRKQNGSSKKPPMFSDTAQSSIQYLAFMADYELLFQTALGLYDFDMARAVARNSQMDPKVYLPLLQQYRSLPMYYGRYQVDVKLKRFESAVRNLHKSNINEESIEINDANGQTKQGNDFSEFLRLIEVHKQHRVGLEVCIDKVQRNLIFQSLGNQLLSEKKPQSALMILLSAETVDEELCIRAAKECQDWSTLFSLSIVTKDEQRRLRLAWEIAEDLSAHAESNQNDNDLLAGASRVLLDYGNDLIGAVKMLMKGELWSEARRIALLHNREDLARKVIDAAISYAQNTVADLEDRAASFAEARTRYYEVLKIRKAAISNAGIDSAVIPDACDDVSLFSAVSNASNLSMRSTASAGSATSLSSVISVKSTNSFSLTGGDDTNRHKSKYNVLGGQKAKKPKKKTKGSNRILPGSEEDLLGLVQTLKSNIIDDKLLLKIGETITFLIYTGHLSIARAIHDSYAVLEKVINTARNMPMESPMLGMNDHRNYGTPHPHRVEAEVAALECAPLPRDIVDIFTCVPPT